MRLGTVPDGTQHPVRISAAIKLNMATNLNPAGSPVRAADPVLNLIRVKGAKRLTHLGRRPGNIVRVDQAKPGLDMPVIRIRVNAKQTHRVLIEAEPSRRRIPNPGTDSSRPKRLSQAMLARHFRPATRHLAPIGQGSA